MLANGQHYTRIETCAGPPEYWQKYNANYFNDLFEIHQALGCAFEKTACAFSAI
jgi:hypothetical protein